MNAKEYLSQLKRLDIKIDQKLSELDDLRSKATAIGSFDYAKDKVQTSLPGDAPYAATVQKIIDLDAEINRAIDRFTDEKDRIINQIQEMDDPRYSDLLYKRYVEYKLFRIIEDEMHYSHSYILVLHRWALQAFDELLKDDTQ